MKIYIGSDHAGFEFKEKLKLFLMSLDHQIIDKGAFEFNESDDYPDFVTITAQSVAADPGSFGIVLGGSGQGEAMCANRIKGVRCAVYYGPGVAVSAIDALGRQSEDSHDILRLPRMHNDANMISLAARFLSIEAIQDAVKIFLETPFSQEERHIRRIAKY